MMLVLPPLQLANTATIFLYMDGFPEPTVCFQNITLSGVIFTFVLHFILI